MQHFDDLTPKHHDFINEFYELQESYAYYFKHGAAAERFTANSSLFDELVASAERAPGSRYVIGGNAAVMAMRMHLEGCSVLLGATLTDRHLLAIPNDIKVVGGPISRDDIHLVLEYKSGESWGPYTAPRANRFIIHNDFHNPRVKSLNEFGRQLENFKPDVFVVSGLQLMDNYQYAESEDVRSEVLESIVHQMLMVPRSTKVHFEMASYTEEEFLNSVQKTIVPYSDSLGMNEQELANLHSLYTYGNVSVVTDSTPRVAAVLDQMRSIFWEIRSRSKFIPGHKTLTRIHVHTLAFQAVMVDNVHGSWKQPDVAAAKASLTAYRHVCASPEVDANQAKLLMDDSFSRSAVTAETGRVVLEPERPVPCWQEGPLSICVATGIRPHLLYKYRRTTSSSIVSKKETLLTRRDNFVNATDRIVAKLLFEKMVL
ncbi:hypothetical protein GE061_012381 [Apolygus lucorum]|uniref:ADP-dependent glucokinase n=1 Tax=Apolygus lucorum TaxID=248454 RepID=A0A8S9XW83_APOLU|nr:hypothetical protein GE061_012381 [Apolygus lucorum]